MSSSDAAQVTALISPIAVHSQVLRKELPILTLVTGLAAWQLWDGEIPVSRPSCCWPVTWATRPT